jgi:hypothetical protein
MSTVQGAVGGSNGAQDMGAHDWANGSWRGRSCGVGRWSPFEIVAMVLGFIVFWPIGLAILGFKMWQRRSGYPGDLQTAAQEKWRDARSAMSSGPWAMSGGPWQGRRGFYSGSTGNLAFDEWKSAEIARLEEERRKLQEAHREFSAFVENIRRAKDREEFERFMNERRNRPVDGAPGSGPAA